MKILFSGFRDKAHSAQGGYDKITQCVGDNHHELLLSDCFMGNIPMQSRFIRVPLLFLDLKTRFLRFNYDITHLFYGDVTIFPFIPYPRNRRHRTVITLHLDIERYRFKRALLFFLRRMDGVVVLSNQQRRLLLDKYGIDSYFVPHGFNPPRFVRSLPCDNVGREVDSDRINIVTVGKMYRDFDALERVVLQMQGRSDLVFHLIGIPVDQKIRFAGYKNVRIYNFLEDSEFYSMIAFADYCFLPLIFATANNTLLEAHSMGTPVIAPNIGGVEDYAYHGAPNYLYDSEADLLDYFAHLTKTTPDDRLIDYSKQFGWDRIGSRLRDVYDSVLRQ